MLTVLAEVRPRHAFLAFDAKNAVNTLHRSAVQRSLAGTPLRRVVAAWYTRGSLHRYWDERGRHWEVKTERGLDQGCPLSPGLFSAALAPRLDEILGRLRPLDPHAEVYAYLDDVFVVIDPQHAGTAANVMAEVLSTIGLTLELGKTKAWTPDPTTALPAGLEQRRVQELTCLGNALPFVRASRDLTPGADDAARVPVGPREGGHARGG